MIAEQITSTLHRKIALDENKRHFVFGDIHGRFTTFQRLLKKIKYDPLTDVIYSVGDMIDRGPDSVKVVQFFQQPHCHAILGNHEQMVLNAKAWEEIWMHHETGGPATLASLHEHGYNMGWLATRLQNLPVCLDIGDETQPSAFRLVHAESPLEWSEDMLMNYLANSTREEAGEGRLLWGRDDVIQVMKAINDLENADNFTVAQNRSARMVFCGHTPTRNVVNAFNVHWIDTKLSETITCIDPANLQTFQVRTDDCDWY